MMDLKALPLLRKNLDQFIRADPVSIALVRYQKQKTAAGGWVKQAAQTLDSQQFRLVPFQRRLFEFTNAGQVAGYVPALKYALIGRWDADILRDDEFDYNTDHYLVVSVEPKTNDRSRTDRVVAEVRVEPASIPPSP